MAVVFKDNSGMVLAALKQAESIALTMIGETQNSIMAELIPVKTGRLLNSRGYKTKNKEGVR